MKQQNLYFESVRKNLEWFRNSPIMVGGGSWGVGERLLLTEGNTALKEIREHFPVVMMYPGGLECLEQRRSDCNFEVALLFYLAGKLLDSPADSATAKELLDFLYFRSGLLNRIDDRSLIGGWTWTHIQRNFNLWMDDNAWVCVIQFVLARLDSGLDRRYELRKWAKLLAADLYKLFTRSFDPGKTDEMPDPAGIYAGRLELPHWAVPVQCALLLYQELLESGSAEYADVEDAVSRYFHYILPLVKTTNASELGYLMILAGTMLFFPQHTEQGRILAKMVYRELEKRMSANPYGILPAEHYEAPPGPHLADLIYTVNFCFLGLALAAVNEREYLMPAQTIGKFLAKIQDDGNEYPELKGCWRGMYDCQQQAYGGGNRYEGGAGSIYSGWTNAPIALAMLLTGKLSSKDS